MATNLTNEIKQGWHQQVNGSARDRPGGAPNPYLWSSDAWLAFEAGQKMACKGLTAPVKATKSRGYSIRIWTKSTAFIFKASGADLEIRDLDRA